MHEPHTGSKKRTAKYNGFAYEITNAKDARAAHRHEEESRLLWVSDDGIAPLVQRLEVHTVRVEDAAARHIVLVHRMHPQLRRQRVDIRRSKPPPPARRRRRCRLRRAKSERTVRTEPPDLAAAKAADARATAGTAVEALGGVGTLARYACAAGVAGAARRPAARDREALARV